MSRPDGLLKMSELAERSGVSSTTIKHYLREGLLGGRDDIVRTSRNMAYYPPDFVERIRMIRRLQDERYMPLKAIREILDRAIALREVQRTPAAAVADRYDVPANVLERLAELGVLSPDGDGYDPDDLQIIEAMERFRAGGFDEALGFTVFDTLRYREALGPLVREEVRILLERLGDLDPDRAVQIIDAGREPLRELIGAMHSKMLLAELRRQRAAGSPPPGARGGAGTAPRRRRAAPTPPAG